MTFNDVLAVGERLAALGLKPAVPAKDVICYVEEWTVDAPEDFDGLDAWSTEDVTLVHVREAWRGDFFLLAGAYHTAYLRFLDVGTYACTCMRIEACFGWDFAMPIRSFVSVSKRRRS
jgi:hypothetical protein